VLGLPLGPLRESDFRTHERACVDCVGKILVQTRLPAAAAEVFDWGIEIDQSRSSRPWSPPDSKGVERCHLLDKVELDPELGVYALCTADWYSDERPPGTLIGVCSWLHLPAAALHLRTKYLSAIGNKYVAFSRHAAAIIAAFNLTERPINDSRLPSYAHARNGILLRFDGASAEKVPDYFVLEEANEESNLVSTPLEDSCCLVCAYSGDSLEPLRAILTVDSWSAGQAKKELVRWLKISPKQKGVSA
jgi:hypothetical protein